MNCVMDAVVSVANRIGTSDVRARGMITGSALGTLATTNRRSALDSRGAKVVIAGFALSATAGAGRGILAFVRTD